ncbi:MAG: MerR family DNA-binding transcriptional regulator [Chloroflexota bacterium]|nr:MerR family DNA-binding transcriptional regulator [Chloroflexota bacterium]
MDPRPNAERLLTISQAARMLGVHQNTLRTWADKGLVRHVRLPSGYRRFAVTEVERLRREMGLDRGDETTDPGEEAGE